MSTEQLWRKGQRRVKMKLKNWKLFSNHVFRAVNPWLQQKKRILAKNLHNIMNRKKQMMMMNGQKGRLTAARLVCKGARMWTGEQIGVWLAGHNWRIPMQIRSVSKKERRAGRVTNSVSAWSDVRTDPVHQGRFKLEHANWVAPDRVHLEKKPTATGGIFNVWQQTSSRDSQINFFTFIVRIETNKASTLCPSDRLSVRNVWWASEAQASAHCKASRGASKLVCQRITQKNRKSVEEWLRM